MSTVQETQQARTGTVFAALVFELDGVAFDLRSALYEAASAAFSRAGLKLSEVQFSRSGLHARAADMAEALASCMPGAPAASDLEAALAKGLEAGLQRAALNPGLDKLIKAAAQRSIPAAALTLLPEEQAAELLARTGLTDRGVRLVALQEEEKGFPRADAWLKAAKLMGRTARFCIAVTGSQTACKSALSAGLRCLAVPGPFTSHSDYSGADYVLDAWDDVSTSELLDGMAPAVH